MKLTDAFVFGSSVALMTIIIDFVSDFICASLSRPRYGTTLKERQRCARIASNFTLKQGRRIHPDIPWEEMNESAQAAAHTTAQQIATAIMSEKGNSK
jgi:hypothetical protein